MRDLKVILVNGSPHEKGCTYTALCEVSKELNQCGITTDIFWIGAKPIAGCIACGACAKLGRCFSVDKVNEFVELARGADGFVFGSPVYYAGMNGSLASFMDRAFYSGSISMRGKPAAAVVSCRRGGASAAFDQINKYFTINCMPVVSSNYWNQVHGNSPEEVLKDEEGLQTMRILGRNMAWLLECIEEGSLNQIQFPEPEAKIKTNFIR